ncbi:MAG: YaaR family protein [Lachnospiraceae bacterium]|nr:YaaR family protein [Lachnospiraceae bacterium]
MDFRIQQMSQIQETQQVQENTEVPADGTFKFTLASQIGESELREALTAMMEQISEQGDRISKKHDIRDMKRYRALIKSFLNEVVTRSHEFSRENFLDRKGRHRVYGIIRQIDDKMDELARALIEDETDNIKILDTIGDIRGLLLDIFT